MPLFRRPSRPEGQAREQAEAAQASSLEALARGGLPVRAQQRLAEFNAAGSFSSDLSVREFALGASAGVQPLTQVMGSSVFHVGWQATPGTWGGWGNVAIAQEMSNLSGAWNTARRLAFGRLEQEARLVGAHAVVGLHVTRGEHDWASGSVEYLAIGTAVRIDGEPLPERPALTDLSGQDFWKLWRTGYRARGVVGGSTVYYVVPGRATRRAQAGWLSGMANQELRDFTQGVYEAREVALQRLTGEALALGADGVVGVSIDQSEQPHEVDRNGGSRTDLVITFHVLGTAIVGPADPGVSLVVSPTLDLSATHPPGANR